MSRIDLIRLHRIDMPLVRPFRTSFGVERERHVLLLEVTTDVGVGWGECVADDPYYNKETDTYRVIHKGHPSASAVTNTEGVTVFFDPDNNDVLGFSIANFSKYYEDHVTPEGEFEVVLPARVPANLEEEMDFDEESMTTNVRIAEIY